MKAEELKSLLAVYGDWIITIQIKSNCAGKPLLSTYGALWFFIHLRYFWVLSCFNLCVWEKPTHPHERKEKRNGMLSSSNTFQLSSPHLQKANITRESNWGREDNPSIHVTLVEVLCRFGLKQTCLDLKDNAYSSIFSSGFHPLKCWHRFKFTCWLLAWIEWLFFFCNKYLPGLQVNMYRNLISHHKKLK